MMGNYVSTKQIEQALSAIEGLTQEFKNLVQREIEARKELELRFMQIISEQQREIARLCKDLDDERKDRRKRRIRALTQFKSE